jgi:uncharacterized membrane protein YgdD (TMEM256/DUF423 family)
MSWGERNGFNLELAAAPTRLTLKSEIIVSETETAFAWLFGLALGAVFAGILLMKRFGILRNLPLLAPAGLFAVYASWCSNLQGEGLRGEPHT